MLHGMAVRSTELLKKREIIVSEKENIYVYGFELLYSLLFSVGTMLVWSWLLGCTVQVSLFLLYFIPLRMAAGGYHAKTYGGCFLGSNVVTLLSVMGAKFLWEVESFQMELALWGLYLCAVIYIARQAPVVSRKASMKEELIVRNKTIARKLLLLGACGLIVMRMVLNNGLSYVGVIAIFIVAFMIRIQRKEVIRDGNVVKHFSKCGS